MNVNVAAKAADRTVNWTEVGLFIWKKRRDMGFTRQAFPDAFDVSIQTVYAWESGKSRCHPSIENAVKIARFFHVTVDQLLQLESEVSHL